MSTKDTIIHETCVAPYGATILLAGEDRLEPVSSRVVHTNTNDTFDPYDTYDEPMVLGDKQCQKSESRLSKSKAKECRAAFHALLKAPRLLPNRTTGWKFLIQCLLAAMAGIVTAKIPGTPIVVLEGLTTIPVALRTLANCFTPFKKLKGDGKIARPSCLESIVLMGSVQPSNDIADYIGGWLKPYGDKQPAWLPLFAVPVVIAPNVPDAIVKTILTSSPLAMPILCGKRSIKSSRPIIHLSGEDFRSYDPEVIKKLDKHMPLIRAQLLSFAKYIRASEKKREKLLETMPRYYPVAHAGKYVTTLDEHPEVVIWAAGLSVFEALLVYASDKKRQWISKVDANQYLLEAWSAVLPESSPEPPSPESASVSVRWDSLPVFWTFVREYLEANRDHIGAPDAKYSADVVAGLQHTKGEEHLVFPRALLTKAYVDYIRAHDGSIPEGNFELDLARKLKEWDTGLRTEGDDITWRYMFYAKGQAPKGEKDKLPCIGIPVRRLPEEIRELLLAGSDSDSVGEIHPNQPGVGAERLQNEEVSANG